MNRAAGWCVALLLLLAGAAPAHAGPPVPLLWKVSDADNAVYLLGSFHLLSAEDYPLSPEVDAAFADAESLLFELAPGEAGSPELAARLAQAGTRSGPGSLREDLGPELWARLERYARANQMSLEGLARFEPWFIGLSIGMVEMGRSGLDPELGLDRHLMGAAARAGKPAAGLERAEQQLAVLAGMALEEQKQLLAEALDEAGKPSQSRELYKAWRAGDAQRLWQEMAVEMRRQYPALYRRINIERNDAWVPQLEARLALGEGEDTLAVVGALHLLGEDGVVEKLRAKGYRVERICTACAD
ncbi:TraB/GumN family protein [Pseudoxanthomonas suwonensis]|uniref:TraB/GumN family protein n=1 Tax=Pseudoxanthomonas suwonensis TaxID=314722 RepID=UPI0004BAAD17|nr:TraB/GumN family protein [Pseudoxanthomonas suwonensis]